MGTREKWAHPRSTWWQESDRSKRKIETEVADLKEQLNERRVQVDEMQAQLAKREEELTQTLLRIDEESATKATAQKAQRELESQLAEIQEDLEAEKAARAKAEKVRCDLSEELEALKNELLDSLDTTAGKTKHLYFKNVFKKSVSLPLLN